MELKMYAFGEEEGVIHWVCATEKEEAINIYKSIDRSVFLCELIKPTQNGVNA